MKSRVQQIQSFYDLHHNLGNPEKMPQNEKIEKI